MPAKTTPLSPTSEKLISAFDEAAKDWGWQVDQGTGSEVQRSENAYIQTDADLRRHVSAMERKVRRLKQELKGLRPAVAKGYSR